MKSPEPLIVVIGRGHSGTRLLSNTLHESGVFLGRRNDRGDTVPPQAMYAAARCLAEHVRWNGDLSWTFDQLHTMPIESRFEDLVREYLGQVLESNASLRGWKLPETTLAYPWIVRMFPEATYVHIVRDPRDCLLRSHITDDLELCNVEYPRTDDVLEQRVASWKYQHEIVKATPQPERFITVRFEDLVLDNERSVSRLEDFLGFPLARVPVDETRAGQWKADPRLLPHIAPLESAMGELGYL